MRDGFFVLCLHDELPRLAAMARIRPIRMQRLNV
jgi:hypothetical protein